MVIFGLRVHVYLIGAIFLALTFTVSSTPIFAQSLQRAPSSSSPPLVECNNPKEPGDFFYDFKKLVIYYMDFPTGNEEKHAGYPAPLRYDTFNAQLLKEVKKNFGLCLKTFWGLGTKPIVVAAPLGRQTVKQATYDTLRREAYDPANLTLVISLRYEMETRPAEVEAGTIALLRFNFYRPGISGHQALPLVPNKSGAIVLWPRLGSELLNVQLAQFLGKIRPSNELGWDKWPPSPHEPRSY